MEEVPNGKGRICMVSARGTKMLDENQKPEKPEGARSLPAALEKYKWVAGQSGNLGGRPRIPRNFEKLFGSKLRVPFRLWPTA